MSVIHLSHSYSGLLFVDKLFSTGIAFAAVFGRSPLLAKLDITANEETPAAKVLHFEHSPHGLAT
jgi:hypothetical protein